MTTFNEVEEIRWSDKYRVVANITEYHKISKLFYLRIPKFMKWSKSPCVLFYMLPYLHEFGIIILMKINYNIIFSATLYLSIFVWSSDFLSFVFMNVAILVLLPISLQSKKNDLFTFFNLYDIKYLFSIMIFKFQRKECLCMYYCYCLLNFYLDLSTF